MRKACLELQKKPISIPKGVDVKIQGQKINIKGPKGHSEYVVNNHLLVQNVNDELLISQNTKAEDAKELRAHERIFSQAIAGTTRANINNIIIGVTEGYMRKLLLVGIGYRAQLKGRVLQLSLGMSHPIEFQIPEGIEIEVIKQTEIVIRGSDKQLVGQVAANIRINRPVEPYKGKGVRYSDETVVLKETKKK